MSTKKLARELGIIRKRSQKNGSNQSKRPGIKQFFPYLIIIDFESTCWREKNNYGQEIIEFPAVLLNTSNGTVESEFHTYVQPQEHPVLSEFCTELTGITQTQVEAGVPLAICLSRFTRWLHSLQQEKGVVFLREGKAPIIPGHPCAFVTWSDWDLGVCLLYECKRKQICKPEVLNSWIDLRATYKLFYSRKPKGLNGALQDLGIEFSGREHSGLDDSRNTARLAWRMITDGCFMKITKSLDRAPVKSKPMFPCNPSNNNTTDPSELSGANTSDESRKEHSENYQLPSTAKSLQTHPTMPAHPSRHVGIDQNPSTSATVCQYQSLVTPKTVLDGLSSRLSVGGTSAPVRKWQGGTILFTGSTPSPEATGLVLVSTTVSTYTDTLPRQLNFDLEASKVDWTDGVVLLSETEESGSYDDVLLEEEEGREGQNKGRGGGLGVPTNSGEGLGRTVSLLAPTSALVLPAPSAALASLGRSKQTSIISTALAVDKNQPLATSEDACFKMPRPVSAPSRENRRPVLRPFINKTTTPDAPHCSISKSSTRSCAATNYKSSNTSTPSQFTSKLSPKTANSIGSTTDHSVYYETPSSSASNRSLCNTATIKNSGSKGSVLPSPLHPNNMPWGAKTTTPSRPFTIYQDINSQSSTSTSTQRSTRVTLSVPPSVLSSHVNQSRPTVCRTEEPKKVSVTSPLCGCGRRAKRLTVGNGGPNHGRGFYCCPVRRSGPGISANGPPKKGCEFFKWESALLASVTPGPSRNTFFSRPSGTLVRTLR